MSNQDVASAFFTRYLEILGINETERKIFTVRTHGGEEYDAGPLTLVEYLTIQTTMTSLRDDFFNTFTSLIASDAKLRPIIIDVLSGTVFEEFKKAVDVDVIDQIKNEDGNESVIAALELRLRKGTLQLSSEGPITTLGEFAEFIVGEIFDFDSHTIIKFAQNQINKYIEDTKRYLSVSVKIKLAQKSAKSCAGLEG